MAIIVRRTAVGRMSLAVFVLGTSAFLLGFVDPFFFPLAWASLIGGAVLALVMFAKHRRASHPTLSHLADDPEKAEGAPHAR